MTKAEFLQLLADAYDFPDYFGHNLDAADEVLADQLEASATDHLPLGPFFDTLLTDVPEADRLGIRALLERYFGVGLDGGDGEELV